MEVDAASTASSALTVRQTPQTASTDDVSAGDTELIPDPAATEPNPISNPAGRRSNHRREPNDLVTGNAALSTVMSEADREHEATESYYTAASPSVFSAPPTTNAAPPIVAPEPVVETVAAVTPRRVLPSLPAERPMTPPAVPQPVPHGHFGIPARMHRFSLVKSGNAKRVTGGNHASGSGVVETSSSYLGGWSPFELLFGSALGLGSGNKCDLCSKRLGWKPCLECDDCGLT